MAASVGRRPAAVAGGGRRRAAGRRPAARRGGRPGGPSGKMPWTRFGLIRFLTACRRASPRMSNRDAQVSHALNRLSWQMKPDYLLATHTPADTQPFIAELDELTHQAAKRGLGIDLASPDGPDPGGRLDAHFSSDFFFNCGPRSASTCRRATGARASYASRTAQMRYIDLVRLPPRLH